MTRKLGLSNGLEREPSELPLAPSRLGGTYHILIQRCSPDNRRQSDDAMDVDERNDEEGCG